MSMKEDSVVNELDMISTILLPPEDGITDELTHFRTKNNPYFMLNTNEELQQYHLQSMINNYQQVAGNKLNRIMAEREMLSSQYSSVASTIAVERPKIKDMSPSQSSMRTSNRNFVFKNGYGKRGIRVPAKLRNFFGANVS